MVATQSRRGIRGCG